jgi:hypothetical protein
MAAGVLVVAPAVGGIAEVVSDATGVLLRDNSTAEIVRGLREAYALDLGERAKRIDRAFEVVQSECSGKSVASALFKLYRHGTQICLERARSGRIGAGSCTRTTLEILQLKAQLVRANALLGIEQARSQVIAAVSNQR